MNTRTKAQVEATPLTESFAGWATLNTDEQKTVKQEADAVIEARKNEAKSREAIGQHLRKLHDVLGPKRLWLKFLKYKFNWSQATAYRYEELAEVAEKILPAPIFEAAIQRGTPIRKELIAENPPPNTTKPDEIQQYLAKLEELPQRRPQAALESDPDVLMKECFNFVSMRYGRLTVNARAKQKWVQSLVGMLLTKVGMEGREFSPVPVPETFEVRRGRPAQVETEKVAA